MLRGTLSAAAVYYSCDPYSLSVPATAHRELAISIRLFSFKIQSILKHLVVSIQPIRRFSPVQTYLCTLTLICLFEGQAKTFAPSTG